MKNTRSERTDIAEEAINYLKEGTSRQETFDILSEKHQNPFIVADILKFMPSKNAIDKFGNWNYFQIFIMILILTLLLWHAFSIWFFLWFSILIYVFIVKLFRYYFLVSVILFFKLLVFIVLFILFEYKFSTIHFSLIILLIPSIVLPFWLEKKLCPKPRVEKVEYFDSSGKKKMKRKYKFND